MTVHFPTVIPTRRLVMLFASASLIACTRTNVALLDQTASYPKTCERGITMYLTPG